ncbi:MAG TPA: cupin domain-containing protein [Terriglobia bacterium]|nr:cupin domain-containing protein [Terriglobia bacterium]
MAEKIAGTITLENRHTGEQLSIRRVKQGDEVWLELQGSLPPHREGPPMHIHLAEDEEGYVDSGVLSFILDGRRMTAGPGESLSLPHGVPHRWWNEGDEPLVFNGTVRPAVDFDRYVQAVFEVMNAGPNGRPPLFYIAHVALRHRRTQQVVILPRRLQALLFQLLVAVGTLLGRYRGNDWPGCPSRCLGVPADATEATFPGPS